MSMVREGSTVRLAVAGEADAVARLVADAGLPLAGLAEAWRVWVAEAGGQIVGTAVLERHGDVLLLRSVVITPAWRGAGLGARLVAAALEAAEPVGPVALLTETAAGWFPRFGFVPVEREGLPAALAASAELQGACPATAVALLRG